MAVDTLKLYERLVKANVAPEASREIAEAISENTRISAEGLSTKEDIARLEGKMATKEDLANLKTEIANLRFELIKWIVGVGIGGFTALLGLLKLIKVI